MANSIEVRVPDEIMDYKESIVMGLSLRQLLFGTIALGTSVPVFFLLKSVNEDLAVFATMAVSAPSFLVGFVKKDGYTFENYFKIHFKNFLSKSKRGYETEPQDELPIECEKYRSIVMDKMATADESDDKKGSEINNAAKKRKKRKSTNTTVCESEFIEIRAKDDERKRKAAYKSLTTAKRRSRAKKQKKKKTSENRSCA